MKDIQQKEALAEQVVPKHIREAKNYSTERPAIDDSANEYAQEGKKNQVKKNNQDKRWEVFTWSCLSETKYDKHHETRQRWKSW